MVVGRSPNGDFSVRKHTGADEWIDIRIDRPYCVQIGLEQIGVFVAFCAYSSKFNLFGIRRQQSCGRPENETRPGRGGGWVSVGGGSVDVDFAARHSLDRRRSEVSLVMAVS